jgi:diadenosine tetraphosphate (Ap4A) HIT family hydrolase
MKDANYPWCILVPDREEITEIYQLSAVDQQQLTLESAILARTLAETFQADKMNIAALGNVVPQLHIHHVVRYQHDAAWPAPIWGAVPAKPYSTAALQAIVAQLRQALTENSPHLFTA